MSSPSPETEIADEGRWRGKTEMDIGLVPGRHITSVPTRAWRRVGLQPELVDLMIGHGAAPSAAKTDIETVRRQPMTCFAAAPKSTGLVLCFHGRP